MNKINLHTSIYNNCKTPQTEQIALPNIDKEIKKIAATIQQPISKAESIVAKANFENTQQTDKPKSGYQIKPIFLFGGRKIKENVYLDFALLDIDGK